MDERTIQNRLMSFENRLSIIESMLVDVRGIVREFHIRLSEIEGEGDVGAEEIGPIEPPGGSASIHPPRPVVHPQEPAAATPGAPLRDEMYR